MSGSRFDSMGMAEANQQCGVRGKVKKDKCGKCDSPVMIHCMSCKIQVTGCVCTEVDRFGETAEGIKTIYDRMAEREGPEAARARLQALGFYVPKGVELS